METWLGWNIPLQEQNTWLSVHFHPSYLERANNKLLDKIFRTQLKEACAHTERPWPSGPPDIKKDIIVEYNEDAAARWLSGIKKGIIAFDYEGNALKPEYEGAELVSVSVCRADGKTLACPLSDKVVAEMKRILTSTDIQKIGANIKFETRWTKAKFGVTVRRWVWDTMLAAHTLKQDKGITGLKFQTFVQFGLRPYNEHIEPFLEQVKGSHLNRINEIPLAKLLEYNGIDSRVTYELAKIQRKQICSAR